MNRNFRAERGGNPLQTTAFPLVADEAAQKFAARPDADIFETKDAFVVTLDMPGARKEGINVTIDRGTLVVKAESDKDIPEGSSALLKEIRRDGYHRAFNLGDGVDKNSVEAKYEQGVLTITLRKKEEMQPRSISIQ